MDHHEDNVGIVYSRRDVLALALSAGASAALTAVLPASPVQTAQGKTALVASPAMTTGPFFVEQKLKRANLNLGANRKSVTGGTPLQVSVKVLKLVDSDFVPFTDAQVDLWHADAVGAYSGFDDSSGGNTTGEDWCRGFQLTDSKGQASFETIVPGWYPGRTPHIHFKVRKHQEKSNKTADLSSQMFFDTALIRSIYATPPYDSRGKSYVVNERDGIYLARLADGSTAGSHLMMNMKKTKSGYHAEFTIVLTDSNFKNEELGDTFDWATF